jgi:hypothetical protein
MVLAGTINIIYILYVKTFDFDCLFAPIGQLLQFSYYSLSRKLKENHIFPGNFTFRHYKKIR